MQEEIKEGETQSKLTSQSEPSRVRASRRQSLENSNVRRQIIQPRMEHSPPAKLTNGTRDSLDSSLSVDLSSVTTAAEALVEMGTGTPPKPLPHRSPTPFKHVDVTIDRERLLALFDRVVVATEGVSCEQMESIHAMLEHVVFRHRMSTYRSGMLEVSVPVCMLAFTPLCLCRTWSWLLVNA